MPSFETISQGSASYIYKQNSPSQDQIDRIKQVFALAEFGTTRQQPDLFVTDDKKLLNNRLWLESKFPTNRLTIVTVEEASEIMDLSCKYNETYYLEPRIPWKGKAILYWISFRSKIPFYNVPIRNINPIFISSDVREALADKFVNLLIAIDELGIQYYLEVNLDTQADTMYHFNYFLALVAGIFDNLALDTKQKLNLHFQGEGDASRTSISNRSGNDFLRALGVTNPDLRQHIGNSMDFINLVFELRHSIIHREGLESLVGQVRESDGSTWKENYVSIEGKLGERIGQVLGKTKKSYDRFTVAGVRQEQAQTFLVPFLFAKALLRNLIPFVNKYLELLGYTNFIESLESGEFKSFVESHRRFNLGV